jgi:Glyoxal oxidase N-terminus
MRRLWVISAFVSLSAYCITDKYESAWNGQTPSGMTTHALFTPYFIPAGAKGYDSSSPFVHYKGTWVDAYSTDYIGGSLRKTTEKGATVYFTFSGTGIEWFGCMGPRHGSAHVYIDGHYVQRIDAYARRDRVQQRLFWTYDLSPSKHTMKIVNAGKKGKHRWYPGIDVDAFVVTEGAAPSQQPRSQNFALRAASSSQGWKLVQKGTTGVNAMQLAIISPSHAIIMDKVEHNPLTVDGHPAWGALYNFNTHQVTPLHMKSNSFCASGAFLSNGTLVSVGGNPVIEDYTTPIDFGQVDGRQALRLFAPCKTADASGCDIYENTERIRLASPRWYPTVVRIQDGSVIIIGGSIRGGWINNSTVNNPTVEFYPPKNIHGENGTPIRIQFLIDTLNSNLFPIAFVLPDGCIFVAANRDAMIYNWQENKEQRLPQIPNGVRVTYPMTGTGLLLPLTPENDYAPEVLICGGSTVDDKKPSSEMSSKDPTSNQCARLLLTSEGIAKGWSVEHMPGARTMPDAVLLPTGNVIIVNGAGTGVSGYGNVRDQVGHSNADAPVRTPVLYDPSAPEGNRFIQGLPESPIPRLYHSTATLTPNGDIMIAGSNPNLDRSEVAYGTEYRVEWLRPPYMSVERPTVDDAPGSIDFGQEVKVRAKIPDKLRDAKIRG